MGLKKLVLTAVWRDWGFRLNGKLVLYLENLCLTEKSRIFNPQPRQAAKRCTSVATTIKIAVNKIDLKLET